MLTNFPLHGSMESFSIYIQWPIPIVCSKWIVVTSIVYRLFPHAYGKRHLFYVQHVNILTIQSYHTIRLLEGLEATQGTATNDVLGQTTKSTQLECRSVDESTKTIFCYKTTSSKPQQHTWIFPHKCSISREMPNNVVYWDTISNHRGYRKHCTDQLGVKHDHLLY
jgi:hypothetical protein